MMRIFVRLLFSGLLTLVLLEGALALYADWMKLPITLPTYSWENAQGFWFDLHPTFGTWHLPQHHYRQKKSCFDIDYYTNTAGFRDQERQLENKSSRVLVLGDSFMEGFGVDTAQRMSNLLQKTKGPHLNFGLAGNFSPTQYLLLYQSVASKYDHDAVLVGLLPANDFLDDDIEVVAQHGTNRYKPFLVGAYPDYQIEYHQDNLELSAATPKALHPLKKMLANYTHAYHFFYYFKALQRARAYYESSAAQAAVPNYFNFTTPQYQRLRYCLEKLRIATEGKPLMLISIPNLQEINQYQKEQLNPLADSLQLLAQQVDFAYLDLLPHFAQLPTDQKDSMFLPCDGHWSPRGHAFAAQLVQEHLPYYAP